MYTEISIAETTAKQFSTMQEAAETIQEKALKKARKKLPAKYQAMSLGKVMQRSDFLTYFKYTLAQEIAQVFAAYDQHVQAVYLFEESTNPGSEMEDYPATVDRCSSPVAFGRIRPTHLIPRRYPGNSKRCRKRSWLCRVAQIHLRAAVDDLATVLGFCLDRSILSTAGPGLWSKRSRSRSDLGTSLSLPPFTSVGRR
jgi:hypothetical protein